MTARAAIDAPGSIRPCRRDEHATIVSIINAAAESYRGAIPEDCWHEPYFASSQLEAEIAAAVMFWGYEIDGILIGVMGFQALADVDLIRHAYVLPTHQGRGVGTSLLVHLRRLTTRRMLVGTWADADWAIQFYQRHGFDLVSPGQKAALARKYWTVPERQMDVSVVLANPPFSPRDAALTQR